jgi:hypothetical protein
MNPAFSGMLGRTSQRGRLRIGVSFASLVPLILLLGSLLASGPARADLAEVYYKRGLVAYEAKDYARAIREFQTAYRVRQLPRILLNIGQVYRKLGMASTALKFYEHYLRVEPKPKPEIKAEVDRYIAQTRAMLDPPDIVPLPSKSAAAAAAEAVASAPSDITPLPEWDDPEARRKGRGQPGSAIVTQPSLVGSMSMRPLPPGFTLVALPPPPPETPVYKKPVFWGVLGGIAGVAIITGIAIGITQANSAPSTVLYPVK